MLNLVKTFPSVLFLTYFVKISFSSSNSLNEAAILLILGITSFAFFFFLEDKQNAKVETFIATCNAKIKEHDLEIEGLRSLCKVQGLGFRK